MNSEELLSSISASKEVDLVFYSDGKRVSSVFDNSESSSHIDADDIDTKIATSIFSYIEHLIIAKAQEHRECEKTYQVFERKLQSIVSDTTIDKQATKKLRDEALIVIDSFLFNKEPVELSLLLAKISPLVAIKIAEQGSGVNNTVIKTFKKDMEKIFNQVSLFTRQLFQSFLMSVTDSSLLKGNLIDIDSPYFIHDKSLVIPIEQDAYTFRSLQKIMIDKISHMDEEFLAFEIDAIQVLYLLRGYLVGMKIR